MEQIDKGYTKTPELWNSYYTGRPYNPASKLLYKGGNRLLLMLSAEINGFSDPRWMTLKQANEKNYKICAGSKGELLEKWILWEDIPRVDKFNNPIIGSDGEPLKDRVMLEEPVVKYFRVFNGEQITGLPELEKKIVPEDELGKMADQFEKSSLCPIYYPKMQDSAYYFEKNDAIYLPPKESFINTEARLSVLLHEMAHSTRHESRLNRLGGYGPESQEYAKEELNAEISSFFLKSDLGLPVNPDSEMMKSHANYVRHCIELLGRDPNEFFKACARAEHITKFLMNNYEKQSEQEIRGTAKINEYEKVISNFEVMLKDVSHEQNPEPDVKINNFKKDFKIIEADHLPEGWEWKCYEDGKGSLCSPEGKSYFSYNLQMNKYKHMDQNQWTFLNKPLSDYQEYAESIMAMELEKKEIAMDIDQSGFCPTHSLIENIWKFNYMNAEKYSLKDLAKLKQKNPGFINDTEKMKCFKNITNECQNQEIQKNKESFIKRELKMEMSDLPVSGL